MHDSVQLKSPMLQQQENRLVQPQTQEQPTRPTNQTNQIHSVRIKKQLEYLSKYRYTTTENQNGTTIIINNLWNDSQPNKNPSEYSEQGYINDGVIGTELSIILSKDYPFKQPTFIHNKDEELTIAELIDEWSPRFKILEMIELIKKRVQQRNDLNHYLRDNFVFHAFKAANSLWLWILLAVLIRVCVGLGSYSGKADWPNLGDFEAHRNWMSVTIHRNIQKWYTELAEQPWWRIDYPPVAAYLSYGLGSIYNKIQPASLLLQNGYESASLFSFMRATVLLIDCIFLIPAIYLVTQELSPLKYRNKFLFNASVVIALIKPDLILIDHGHFQYNCLMLGLILYAFYCMITNRRYSCCILFTIAINCKLMSVYFSLAFLAGLLGITIRKYGRNRKSSIITECVYYGLIVIFTTFILWLPWMGSVQSFTSVLQAIFPVHRGLYQLKVPNFWCISDVVMKWQSWLSKPILAILCFISCVIFSLPSMAVILLKPTHKVLVIGFSCISMTFFMFSYHVHEKSILVPLCIIPLVSQYLGGSIVMDLVVGGCVGMYHLLKEDGQQLQYFALMTLYIVLGNAYYICEEKFMKVYHPHSHSFYHDPTNTLAPIEPLSIPQNLHLKYCNIHNIPHMILIYGGLIALHIGQLFITPPASLPYLWNLLFAFYSFALNAYFLLICNLVLFQEIKSNLYGAKKD